MHQENRADSCVPAGRQITTEVSRTSSRGSRRRAGRFQQDCSGAKVAKLFAGSALQCVFIGDLGELERTGGFEPEAGAALNLGLKNQYL